MHIPIPIYLLNCQGAEDRETASLVEINRVFGRAPITVYSPNKNDPGYLRKTFPCSEPESWVSPGALCCATGHILMWQKFLRSDMPYAFFMEDDIRLLRDMYYFEAAIDAVRRFEWHWINFEHMFEDDDNNKAIKRTPDQGLVEVKTDKLFHAFRTSLGTACYAMTRRGAKFMLEVNIPIIAPSDHAMVHAGSTPGILAFNVVKAYAGQSGAPSIINS